MKAHKGTGQRHRIFNLTGDNTALLSNPTVQRALKGDAIAAQLLLQAMHLSTRYGHAEGWFARTLPEWADELGVCTKTIQRKIAKLEAFGLETSGTWSKYHSAPHVNHHRVNEAVLLAKVNQVLGCTNASLQPPPDLPVPEEPVAPEHLPAELVKVDTLSTSYIQREKVYESAFVPGSRGTWPKRSTNTAGSSHQGSRSSRKEPGQATLDYFFSELGSGEQLLAALDDKYLFAPYRPQMEAFVRECYDDARLPAEQVAVDLAGISKFVVGQFHHRLILDDLARWYEARPRRIFHSDLRMIVDTVNPISADHFLYVLKYLVSEREAVEPSSRRPKSRSIIPAQHLLHSADWAIRKRAR